MARVLIVQHSVEAHLGWLADWLPAAGLDVHPIHPYMGHRMPTAVEGDALIVLGGKMGASDDLAARWLPAVRDLLSTAVEDGVPTLGVCLGAQLLAVARGGEVRRAESGPEIGVVDVTVHQGDDLFEPETFPTVQWHYDEVTRLPEGAVLLGSSERFVNQVFRVGDLAWGVQFHPEARPDMVAEWQRADGADPSVVEQVRFAEAKLAEAGQRLADRFAAIVTG